MQNNIIFHGNDNLYDLIVHWFPTSYCNYSCSYCISHSPHVGKEMQFADISVLKNVVDKIFNINKERYVFLFSGGEPTIYPQFKELIKYILKNKNSFAYLFSNTHKNENYFQDLFIMDNFYLNFSIHLEYANIDHVKNIIKYANNFNKYIMVSLMVNPDLKEKCILFFNELLEYRKQYFFGLDLGLIYDNNNDIGLDSRYNQEDIDWFYKASEKFYIEENNNAYNGYIPDFFQDYNTKYIFTNYEAKYIPHRQSVVEKMKNFKDFYCLSGVNSISIDSNGNYKGQECSISNVVGNIHREEIDFFELIKPIKCNLDICDCRINNYIPKYRYKNDAYNKLDFYIENIIPTRYLYNIILNLKGKILSNEKIFFNLIDFMAWFIPVRKWRDNFRNKFKIETRPDQTRPDQTRPDQTRPNYHICSDYIYLYNNTKYNKLQPMLQYKTAA